MDNLKIIGARNSISVVAGKCNLIEQLKSGYVACMNNICIRNKILYSSFDNYIV